MYYRHVCGAPGVFGVASHGTPRDNVSHKRLELRALTLSREYHCLVSLLCQVIKSKKISGTGLRVGQSVCLAVMDSDRESRDGRLCELTMDGRTYPACIKRPKQHVVFEASRHYIHAWRCYRHRGTNQACEPTRWSEKRRLEFDVDRTPCPACIGRTVQFEVSEILCLKQALIVDD